MPSKSTLPPMPIQGELLSAQEACEVLGIKQATLYTYVSRGLLKPIRPPDSRSNRYRRAELENLLVRSSSAGGHAAAAAMAMRWGQPVLNTSITEITPQGPRYRGHLFDDLTRHPGVFENVAELLWSGVLPDDPHAWDVTPLRADIQRAMDGVPNADIRLVRVFAIASTVLGGVPLTDELRSGSIAHYSHELLLTFAGATGVLGPKGRFLAPSGETPVAVHMLQAMGISPTEQATQAINAALIVAADHDLTSATLAARIAASVGAGLHACIMAALAAQSGNALAGGCEFVEELLCGISSERQLKEQVRKADQRRQRLPGFGLPLYPDGDPRAKYLIRLALDMAPASKEVELASKFVDHVRANVGIHANIEVGLAILALALGLPRRASGALWVIGRTAGWIAHVLEQRRAGHMLRARGHYVAQTY